MYIDWLCLLHPMMGAKVTTMFRVWAWMLSGQLRVHCLRNRCGFIFDLCCRGDANSIVGQSIFILAIIHHLVQIWVSGTSFNDVFYTPTITHSLTHSFTHSLVHSLTLSLTHSFTLSLIHSLTHSLTHSLSHSLTYTDAHFCSHSHTLTTEFPDGTAKEIWAAVCDRRSSECPHISRPAGLPVLSAAWPAA